MGSAAAYGLVRRGCGVEVYEQFGRGHRRGSSHGAARIIRHSYSDASYARLMPRAYRLWGELEAAAAVPLLTRTGGVSVAPPGGGYVAAVAASLAAVGVPHRRMSGEEWGRRNPLFGVDPASDVVFEPDAGMLAADRAVLAMHALAERAGAAFHFETPVTRIDLAGSRPAVVVGGEALEAERLIVAAGAWVARLLPGLGALRPTRQRVHYLAAEDPAYRVGRLPVFIHLGDDEGDAYYGMPDTEGRGVKVAQHFGPPCDPEAEVGEDPAAEGRVREFLRGFLPGLAAAAVTDRETCLYTMAPGEEFVVGPLPGRPDVLVASPCSGHGFKFAPLVGEVLADLAIEGATIPEVGAWTRAVGRLAGE
jgi:sarcosine oxidase